MRDTDIDSALEAWDAELTVPRDIYSTIHEVFGGGYETHSKFNRSNHFDLTQHFTPALVDLHPLTAASLRFMPEYINRLPRLMALKEHFQRTPSAVPGFFEHFSAKMGESLQDSRLGLIQDELTAQRAAPEWEYYPDFRKDAIINSTHELDVGSMIQDNMNQNIRALQEHAWVDSAVLFALFTERLTQWCKQRDWKFSLRSPLAMTASIRKELMERSLLAGIDAESFLPQSVVRCLHTLQNIHRTTYTPALYLFDSDMWEDHRQPISPSVWSLLKFHWWDQSSAYAIAKHATGIEVAIIPATLPPWLYSNPGLTIPAYLREPRGCATYTEQSVVLSRIPSDDIDILGLHLESNYDAQYETLRTCLNLCTVGFSLLAHTVRLGSGHRRIFWTQTPMNRITIRWFASVLPRMYRQLGTEI